jgi:hypothetical protein
MSEYFIVGITLGAAAFLYFATMKDSDRPNMINSIVFEETPREIIYRKLKRETLPNDDDEYYDDEYNNNKKKLTVSGNLFTEISKRINKAIPERGKLFTEISKRINKAIPVRGKIFTKISERINKSIQNKDEL